MSAPERIWAWWEFDNDHRAINQWEDEPSSDLDAVFDHAEYIRADTAAEMLRQAMEQEREACAIAAGNAAVEALLRQEPDAGLLRRQLVRTNAIRAVRLRGKA